MLLLHLVNRLLAALVSLALVVLAALVAVEVVRWFIGESSWLVPWRSWTDDLSAVRADDPAFLATAALLAVVGLLLLVFELKPRRPDSLRAAPLLPEVHTVVTRKGVASTAETAARSVNGVTSASGSVRRSRVDVTARTRARGEQAGMRDRVREAVERSLADLELERRPRVRVHVTEES